MPRLARVRAPGFVYHVTHRGNRRAPVFLEPGDQDTYLRWLDTSARKHGLEIWAFCLMTNHVHLIVRGASAISLSETLHECQGRWARHVNRRAGWSGHLWAGRYYSAALDESQLPRVIRYVERNPVRAGLVERAEHYPWSSAPAHCGLAAEGLLSYARPLPREPALWKSFLEESPREEEELIRSQTLTGRPIGGADFILRLEAELGRQLARPPQGRPRKEPLNPDTSPTS